MKQIFAFLLASGSFCFAQEHHGMPNDPRPTPTPRPPPSRFVEPNFLLPANPDVNDYRPVVNAEGTMVIFERNPTATPNDVKLYIADLSTGNVQRFVNFASARADWCWDRSGGGLTSGPVAFSKSTDCGTTFSNDCGIYTVATGGQPVLLPNTAGMIYPSWYPGCQYFAADVGASAVLAGCDQDPARPLTAKIDATTGEVVICRLANDTVWAGFPSVNQTNPNLIAFAGQFNGESNYYNEDLNYAWVTDRSTVPPTVAPLDRKAPGGPAFQQKFQARAGWWSPDGDWFAFESNRICNENDGAGQTYAIFIQDANGARPAMQVSDCASWNVQHPKWFPPRQDGRVLLIAAVQAESGGPFRIASFDVSRFVQGTVAHGTPNQR
jgi:hypothetical protein